METVPFFTPRGKLILNKGAMPPISRLKGLSVCVNVVFKNTKLIWENLNSAETEKKIRQRKTDLKTSINNKSRQKHVTPLYTYGHASVSTPCCIYCCISLRVVAQSLKRVKRLYSYANNVGSCCIRLHEELVTCTPVISIVIFGISHSGHNSFQSRISLRFCLKIPSPEFSNKENPVSRKTY